MTETRYQIVFVTAANPEQADRIAAALIEENLAACVNVVGSCRSIYRWKGEVTRDNEVLMLAKAKRDDFDAIVRKVTELHSYEVPEIIAVGLESLSGGYGEFLRDVLGD
jgi:periplasmic divalent cation tolerance protein